MSRRPFLLCSVCPSAKIWMAASWCRPSKSPPQITRIPQLGGRTRRSAECILRICAWDPAAAQAVLQQFVALGYIQPLSEDQEKAVATAVREQQYNLARSYMDSRPLHRSPDHLSPNSPRRIPTKRASCNISRSATSLSGSERRRRSLLQKLLVLKPKPRPQPKQEPDQEAAEEPKKLNRQPSHGIAAEGSRSRRSRTSRSPQPAARGRFSRSRFSRRA